MIIKIDNFSVNCVIGVYDFEKAKSRQILISLEIVFDFNIENNIFHEDKILENDKLSNTIDYDGIVKILQSVSNHKFNLIESICCYCGQLILKQYSQIKICKVCVKKPYAIIAAEVTGVENTFYQNNILKNNN